MQTRAAPQTMDEIIQVTMIELGEVLVVIRKGSSSSIECEWEREGNPI